MSIIYTIQANLSGGLPGREVQYRMAPLGRAEQVDLTRHYRQAAVLCLFYPVDGEWHTVFIKRSSHDRDKHSDQIAFPGGKMEEEDKDHVQTALREAAEEVNVDRAKVRILGSITPLPIPVSAYEVHPVLGYTDIRPDFIPQNEEVESIIEVPVRELLSAENMQYRTVRLSSGVLLHDVPVYVIGPHIIWGATAMILSEILHLLQE